MYDYRKFLIVPFFLIASITLNAQLEVDQLSFKGFSAFGFGGFFNFAIPVSDANYVTGEIGLDGFSNNGNTVALVPMLAGFRYTFDGTGTGFYAEPNAGYNYAGTDIQVVNADGIYSEQKISGLATGLTLGYLFQPTGKIQFNLGLRYEHTFFDNGGSNMFSFRISHALTFGRRE